MTAAELEALQSSVEATSDGLRVTWRQRADAIAAKMMEAEAAGGVTSYTINGRTVTKSLEWLASQHKYAISQANIEECGGIDSVSITFR
jgi:hypothetical protein